MPWQTLSWVPQALTHTHTHTHRDLTWIIRSGLGLRSCPVNRAHHDVYIVLSLMLEYPVSCLPTPFIPPLSFPSSLTSPDFFATKKSHKNQSILWDKKKKTHKNNNRLILYVFKFTKKVRRSMFPSALYTLPLFPFLECGCDAWKCSSHHVTIRPTVTMSSISDGREGRQTRPGLLRPGGGCWTNPASP